MPVVLAATFAGATYVVAADIPDRYEATAAVRIQPLVTTTEIDRLRAAAGLPRGQDDQRTPFLPGGLPVLERIAHGLDPNDIRVIDTESELVFPKYREPIRRLKVKVLDDSPTDAARTADKLLGDYLRERTRVLVSGLDQAGARLRAAATPRLRRASQPLRLEAAEATELAAELTASLPVGQRLRARPPTEPILPHPLRDAVVAGLIGAIVGWCLLRLLDGRERRRARRAPADAPA